MRYSVKFIEDHDIRIDNHEAYTSQPPYYYEPLRLAFQSYFSTFHTFNATYERYASGFGLQSIEHKLSPLNFLDSSNTVETILYFHRFFEHYFKDQLYYLHPKLVQKIKGKIDIQRLTTLLNDSHPDPLDGRVQTIQFKDTLSRFYLALQHPEACKRLIERNGKKLPEVLDNDTVKEGLELLGMYRNRLLHNGSKVPSLWMLDYFISQGIAPIIRGILAMDQPDNGIYPYYLRTPLGIDILTRICKISFHPDDLLLSEKKSQAFKSLMALGHLKELGRASLNMTFFAREYGQAGHEYNYKDISGRGQRIALAESEHEHFEMIKDCPCCENHSSVLYSLETPDIFDIERTKTIKWVKCYTCEYHLRMNTGEPKSFGLASEWIFQ